MPNPFHPKPQRPFDPHRFERLRDFFKNNSIDWRTYFRSLLIDGLTRLPAPFIYGSNIYVDRADVSSFREHLQAESLRRVAELVAETRNPCAGVGVMSAIKQSADARGWRKWAKDNNIGVNFVWRAISQGKLKVRRVGKRMIVIPEDGNAYLNSLPEGRGVKPVNFQKTAAE